MQKNRSEAFVQFSDCRKLRSFVFHLTTSLPFPQAPAFPNCLSWGTLCREFAEQSFLPLSEQSQECQGFPRFVPMRGFRNDRDSVLHCAAQKNLGGCFTVLFGKRYYYRLGEHFIRASLSEGCIRHVSNAVFFPPTRAPRFADSTGGFQFGSPQALPCCRQSNQ